MAILLGGVVPVMVELDLIDSLGSVSSVVDGMGWDAGVEV